jgi:hypothetical protein
MNKPAILSGVLSLFAASSVYSAQLFYNGFESYASNANISGQPVGTWTWGTQGVLAGDQAIVSTTSPFAGTKCLLIADNGANAPRAKVDLVASGYLSSALARGTVSFYIREDSADGSAADQFRVTMSHVLLSRDSSNKLTLSNDQGGTFKVVNFTGTSHTYTPGSWNRFDVAFDNALRQADLYVNGGYAGTITGTTQDYSISSITLGSFASTSTLDKIFFDDVSLSGPYFNNFESYAAGSNVQLLPSNTGTGTWTTTGVLATDLAIVSSDFSFGGGTNSLLLSDSGSNVPSARIDFVATGLTPSPAQQGEISFAALEDPNDSGAPDGYFISIGSTGTTGFTITNDVNKKVFVFTLNGTSTYFNSLPYVTENYTYTPGEWNTFRVRFDNTAKTADLYINGGYAGSQMVPFGTNPASIDLSAKAIRLTASSAGSAKMGDKIYYDNFSADFAPPMAPAPWRSILYPETWTPGFADTEGRTIQDFSYAGYHSGTAQIPTISSPIYDAFTVYGADPTGLNDSSAAIQNAINAAASAGGGVVYLPSGTYRVAPSGSNAYALRISSSNIVLRGAGAGQTFLYNSSTTMKGKAVISVTGTGGMDWYVGGTPVNLSSDLAIGDQSVQLGDTGTFAIGDLVVIRNDLTFPFIKSIGNEGLSGWTGTGAFYPNRMLAFARRVVSKTPTTLILDVPLRYGVKVSDKGRVFKVSKPVVQEVGLENFSIGMKEVASTLAVDDWENEGTGGYNADQSFAVLMEGTENCWVRQVKSYKPSGNATFHTISNAIKVNKSRFVTLDSCDFRLAQYKGANGNGYLYTIMAQETLIQDCYAEAGRHNISIGHMYSCGNVFLRMYLKDSTADSDFHQHLSMSNLFDSTTCDGEMIETRLRTEVSNPAPGWTSTESVFWNTKGLRYADHDTQNSLSSRGLRIIQSYQIGHGYVIGTQGPAYAVTTTNFAEGIGKGEKLVPASLYLDQRFKRLGY